MATPPPLARTTQLFLRLLGCVYAIAFVSLWMQIEGLIGSRGILPIAPYLAELALRFGPERYAWFPTLLWFGASDLALHLLCGVGVAAAVLVLVGRLQTPALVLAWAAYLSLTTAGRDFLAFQWDNFLLEAGFLAIFLLPPRWRAQPEPPSPVALWLLRWLLFRLMFMSGVVKLSSGDPTWRGLTAFNFHYETQPLPTVLGWYAHQLPAWLHAATVVVMFTLELVLPFAIFGPRRLRQLGAAGILLLQIGIAFTGNYGFFNLLTGVLAVLLLDDGVGRSKHEEKSHGFARFWPWAAVPVAVVVLVVSAVQLAGAFRLRPTWPRPVVALYQTIAPFRSINGYGLFAVMTTERPEIIVEGSRDGETWQAYSFRFKPGDLTRRPRFCAPHMPRLDWQMWFAALGSPRNTPWFENFLARLSEGSPTVLRLLEKNPFEAAPPRYLRARVEDYRFTDLAEKRAMGAWWRREEIGVYFPAISAEELARR